MIVRDQNVREDQNVYVNQNHPAVHQSFIENMQIELWERKRIHAVQQKIVVQDRVINSAQVHAIRTVVIHVQFHAVILVLIHVSFIGGEKIEF